MSSRPDAAPPISPDGKFWWNGTAWMPMPGSQAATPPTPTPASPHIAPVSSALAWLVAVSPLLLALTVIAWGQDPLVAAGIGTSLLATVFISIDGTRLRKAGHDKAIDSSLFPLGTLFIYAVAVPWYLIVRTKIAKSTAVIPVAWFVSMAIFLATVILLSASTVDVTAMEADLEGELILQGVESPWVGCTRDVDYQVGDKVRCELHDGDEDLVITLTIQDDGYVYQVSE